jgi:hypothetical protein
MKLSRDDRERTAEQRMDSRTNGHAFSATPPESRYSKPEGPIDASVLMIEGRTYAESKVRSATKPGTG